MPSSNNSSDISYTTKWSFDPGIKRLPVPLWMGGAGVVTTLLAGAFSGAYWGVETLLTVYAAGIPSSVVLLGGVTFVALSVKAEVVPVEAEPDLEAGEGKSQEASLETSIDKSIGNDENPPKRRKKYVESEESDEIEVVTLSESESEHEQLLPKEKDWVNRILAKMSALQEEGQKRSALKAQLWEKREHEEFLRLKRKAEKTPKLKHIWADIEKVKTLDELENMLKDYELTWLGQRKTDYHRIPAMPDALEWFKGKIMKEHPRFKNLVKDVKMFSALQKVKGSEEFRDLMQALEEEYDALYRVELTGKVDKKDWRPTAEAKRENRILEDLQPLEEICQRLKDEHPKGAKRNEAFREEIATAPEEIIDALNKEILLSQQRQKPLQDELAKGSSATGYTLSVKFSGHRSHAAKKHQASGVVL